MRQTFRNIRAAEPLARHGLRRLPSAEAERSASGRDRPSAIATRIAASRMAGDGIADLRHKIARVVQS